ncbi:AfsR/SARP family transcriptional regulator [Nocardia higoensis]|uniref:AfsR/SARP family transcriptional regulator n=1 Tax=Nocardia higoensis TaxID=228599 RepID=UPI0006890186|nr:BTAD domain-containing putative transcriptional regulator [Nocardia higoensis]
MSAHQRGPAGPAPLPPASGDGAIVVGLLGEIALRRDGALTSLPGVRARLLLTALAVRPGRHRSAAALIEDVWAHSPPRAPMNALHTQVSRLRALLPEGALEIGPAGYRLRLRPDQVDLAHAEDLVTVARAARERGEIAAGLAAVARARSLWRGEPADDLPPGGIADDLRASAAARAAELGSVELALHEAAGDLDSAVRVARRSAAADPLDEPAQLTLMRLLAATGRPTEALESFAGFRARLADHLGADPGPALIAMNTAILRGEVGGHAPHGGPADPGAHGFTAQGGEGIRPGSTAVGGRSPGHEFGHPGAERAHPAIGLRAAPNPLLGRASDIDALVELVAESRVVTVLGPGGTGKTRIANELGTRLARTTPVVLVELASVRSGPDVDARIEVEAAISATLGLGEVVREPASSRWQGRVDARLRLREALAARPILVILDNCEHLVDAVATVVADLIGACAQLTVVTTSRAPLAITAEAVYPLAPLAIDPAGSPATDLFAARARAVRPAVRLDPEVVARLCAMLDGLPLAIELAAARARTMSVEEIETRLEHRFTLLRGGDRSSPERHRTLHAVIAWSWNLLDAAQQRTLRRMCRFPAGFTLSAAEIVAGGADFADVAESVDGLVGQSLLTVLDDAEGTGVRYRMLETVREFGEEQLLPEEAEEVEFAMRRWGRSYALAATRRYRGPEQAATVRSVTEESDNLVAVLRGALDRRDSVTAYLVFPVVGVLWMIRGAHLELTGWAPRMLACPPPDHDRGERTGTEDEAAGVAVDLQMIALLMFALHAVYIGNDMRAFAVLCTRIRRLVDVAALNPGLRLLGRLMLAFSGRRAHRVPRLLAEGARSADPDVRIAALVARANVRENAGVVHGSARDAERALDLMRERDAWGTAMTCQHLGQLAGQTGAYPDSVRYYREAAELLEALEAHEEVAEIRSFLAISLIADGRPGEAARELSRVPASVAEGGRPAPIDDPGIHRNHRVAAVAAAVAELRLAEGDIDTGLRYYRRALMLLSWPEDSPAPGPGGIMLAAAVVAAHVLHGRAEQIGGLAAELIGAAVTKLAQLFDLPQIGTAACAVGSWALAVDPRSDHGLELLALAGRAVARQDYASIALHRHLDLHAPVVGRERMGAALRRSAESGRRSAALRIIEVLERHFAEPDR